MEEEIKKPPMEHSGAELLNPSFWEKLKVNKFKLLTGVLGIFIFAVAVFGAYKFGQKQIQPIPQPTTTPAAVATPTPELTPVPKTTPTPQPKPSVKQGWRQYFNTELGLVYQLPQEDWRIFSHPQNLTCDLLLERNEGDQYICIKLHDNPQGLSRRKFFCEEVLNYKGENSAGSFTDCLGYSQIQEVKIGNKAALKIYFNDGSSLAGDYYVLSHKGKIIIISDYYALFPKIANPSGFSWNTLRDEIVATFWFE